MAAIAGRISRVRVNDGGGYDYINGIVDATLNVSVATLKTTSHDSTGDSETFIAGRKNLTLDLKLRWDESDAGQVSLFTAWASASTPYTYSFRMQEGTGFRDFIAQGVVTKYSPSGPNDDVAALDVSIQLSGAVTTTPQS